MLEMATDDFAVRSTWIVCTGEVKVVVATLANGEGGSWEGFVAQVDCDLELRHVPLSKIALQRRLKEREAICWRCRVSESDSRQ